MCMSVEMNPQAIIKVLSPNKSGGRHSVEFGASNRPRRFRLGLQRERQWIHNVTEFSRP